MFFKKINDRKSRELINEAYSKLDWSITCFEERYKIVSSLFTDEIADMVNTFMINQSLDSKFISEDFEMITKLYNISTYLLSSKDIESGTKLDDKFHNDQREFARAEANTLPSSDKEDLFEVRNNDNYKLDKSFKFNNLNKNDLKNRHKFVKDYFNLMNAVKKEVKSKVSIKEIQTDICLIAQRHAIVFKSPLADSYTELEAYMVDLSDLEILKMLIKLPVKEQLDYLNDFDLVLDEFYNLIRDTKLKPIEIEIIDKLQLCYTQVEIADDLGYAPSQVTSQINTICKKLQETYFNKLEDFLFTNYRKGTYKKCTKCNEVKLVSRFGKDNKNKDGYKARCKACVSKKS